MNRDHGGTYISLTTKDDNDFAIHYSHMEMLEQWMTEYIAGSRHDCLLNLEFHNGGTLRVPLSQIAYFADNTPDQREANWEHHRIITSRRKELHPSYESD